MITRSSRKQLSENTPVRSKIVSSTPLKRQRSVTPPLIQTSLQKRQKNMSSKTTHSTPRRERTQSPKTIQSREKNVSPKNDQKTQVTGIENENKQSVLNINIHVPPININSPMSGLPPIQPIICLNVDDITKSLLSRETSSVANEVIAEKLKDLLTIVTPKTNIIYGNTGKSASPDNKSEKTCKCNLKYKNLETDNKNSYFELNSSSGKAEEMMITPIKKINVLESYKSSSKKKLNFSTNDKDFESVAPKLKKKLRSLVRNKLRKSLSSSDLEELKILTKERLKNSVKKKNKTELSSDYKRFNLKNSSVVLEDISHLLKGKIFSEKGGCNKTEHVSPDRSEIIKNFNFNEESFNRCSKKLEKEGCVNGKSVLCGNQKNVFLTKSPRIASSESSRKMLNIDTKEDHLISSLSPENKNTKPIQNKSKHKKLKRTRNTSNNLDRDSKNSQEIFESVKNSTEPLNNSFGEIKKSNCDSFSCSELSEGEIATDSSQILLKNVQSPIEKQTNSSGSVNSVLANEKNDDGKKPLKFDNNDLLLLPKKNGEVYSIVYESDVDEMSKRKKISSISEGCNFSEIIQKIQNSDVRKEILSFVKKSSNVNTLNSNNFASSKSTEKETEKEKNLVSEKLAVAQLKENKNEKYRNGNKTIDTSSSSEMSESDEEKIENLSEEDEETKNNKSKSKLEKLKAYVESQQSNSSHSENEGSILKSKGNPNSEKSKTEFEEDCREKNKVDEINSSTRRFSSDIDSVYENLSSVSTVLFDLTPFENQNEEYTSPGNEDKNLNLKSECERKNEKGEGNSSKRRNGMSKVSESSEEECFESSKHLDRNDFKNVSIYARKNKKVDGSNKLNDLKDSDSSENEVDDMENFGEKSKGNKYKKRNDNFEDSDRSEEKDESEKGSTNEFVKVSRINPNSEEKKNIYNDNNRKKGTSSEDTTSSENDDHDIDSHDEKNKKSKNSRINKHCKSSDNNEEEIGSNYNNNAKGFKNVLGENLRRAKNKKENEIVGNCNKKSIFYEDSSSSENDEDDSDDDNIEGVDHDKGKKENNVSSGSDSDEDDCNVNKGTEKENSVIMNTKKSEDNKHRAKTNNIFKDNETSKGGEDGKEKNEVSSDSDSNDESDSDSKKGNIVFESCKKVEQYKNRNKKNIVTEDGDINAVDSDKDKERSLIINENGIYTKKYTEDEGKGNKDSGDSDSSEDEDGTNCNKNVNLKVLKNPNVTGCRNNKIGAGFQKSDSESDSSEVEDEKIFNKICVNRNYASKNGKKHDKSKRNDPGGSDIKDGNHSDGGFDKRKRNVNLNGTDSIESECDSSSSEDEDEDRAKTENAVQMDDKNRNKKTNGVSIGSDTSEEDDENDIDDDGGNDISKSKDNFRSNIYSEETASDSDEVIPDQNFIQIRDKSCQKNNEVNSKIESVCENNLEFNKKNLENEDTLTFQLKYIKKEMLKRGLNFSKKEKQMLEKHEKKRKTEVIKAKTGSSESSSTPPNKMKKSENKPEISTKAKTKKKVFLEDYIPLEATGPTKFAVANLDKVQPYKEHEALSFKEKMLFGDRIKRFSSTKDLKTLKLKQKVRGKKSGKHW